MFKWKVNATEQCHYCNQPGYCMHMFFSCNEVMKFWNEVERNIKIYVMSNFKFRPCHLLFGINFNSNEEKDVDLLFELCTFHHLQQLCWKRIKKEKNKTETSSYFVLPIELSFTGRRTN